MNTIQVNPTSSTEKCVPYITFTLLTHFFKLKCQIDSMFDVSNNTAIEEFMQLINPYDCIFSKVPGTICSVSKLTQPKTNVFYDLSEILNNLFKFDERTKIQSLHISPNYEDSVECFNSLREGRDDTHIVRTCMNVDDSFNNMKYDFIYYETTSSDYLISMVQCLLLIFKHQSYNGNIIININHVFYKPIVDILYLLTSLYDKVYINKPTPNNVTSFNRYIVCKHFHKKNEDNVYLKNNYLKILVFLKKLGDKYIVGILKRDIPYYFKNKIDDINVVLGQRQLEALNQMIAVYKNKNKHDKIETLKKSNIQKSIAWCEKYKIPCHKFNDKLNIFVSSELVLV